MPFGASCIPPVCFWVSLKVPFSNIFLSVCLPIKKKKKKEAAKFEESFLEKETFKALSDLNWDKAPRSDGFLMAF